TTNKAASIKAIITNVTEDDDADDDWDEFETDDDEMYDGWDYLARYGEDAWEKLLQARLARHRNILLRLFTRRLPNLSEQAKNVLFDAFFRSDAFGVSEHNALLDALAHPVEARILLVYTI
ncbi:15529_t:CDS:2, partial [Funneliformis geosporum]